MTPFIVYGCLFVMFFFMPCKLCFSAEKTHVFYVAETGHDTFSGTLPDVDPEKNDGPFASLVGARNAVRMKKKKNPGETCIIFVRAGTYYLGKTFSLGPEDSGEPGHPVEYRAYHGESPILSSARPITGFKPHMGSIMKADLSKFISGQSQVYQLFVHGVRQPLARFPNQDVRDTVGSGFLYVEKNKNGLTQTPKGSPKEWGDLSEIQMVVFPGSNWTNNYLTGIGLNRKSNSVKPLLKPTHDIVAGNRYYFQNVFEELDSPGEWYFNSKTKILYFWPVHANDLSGVTFSALDTTLEIKGGKPGAGQGNVSDIVFEGFTFEGASGNAVVVSQSSRIVIARSKVRSSGRCGIVVEGGKDNLIFGNDIWDVGHTGIKVSGGDPVTLTASGHRVTNNHIHHTGVIHKGGASGILCDGVGNIVSNNEIHSTPRGGIWFSGNDHVIEYNAICDTNRETQDSGMIYAGQVDWTKRGTVIRYNYLRNSGGYGRRNDKESWKKPYETYGVYLDDWASGTTVYGNVIVNVVNGGIFIHGGRDNVIENNMILNGGGAGQIVLSSWLPDHPVAKKWLPVLYSKVMEKKGTIYEQKYPELTSIISPESGSTMSGNRILRNIIYNCSPGSTIFDVRNSMDFESSTSDFNIIFSCGHPVHVRLLSHNTSASNWSAWKKKGFDGSSIEADPLIADFAQGDFSLLSDSPALKLGFKPIPFKHIGLMDNLDRAGCFRKGCYVPDKVKASVKGLGKY